MVHREKSDFKDAVKRILNQMTGINKWQYKFFIEVMGLFLSIKGRINFLQLGRYGLFSEQRYRSQFKKDFDFLTFNRELIHQQGSGHYIVAFDPSYISKSGKATPGVGYYWSGVAGKAKWGLELSGIAAVDIEAGTAFHLEAVQTPGITQGTDQLGYYAGILVDRKEHLQQISRYVVVDAFFSKYSFVSDLTENGFEIISRLRDDADLLYKYTGQQKQGRGRPRKYSGKVSYQISELDTEQFTLIQRSLDEQIYRGIVYSKSLKREINLVLVYTLKKGEWSHKLYFSTDLNLGALLLLSYYRIRFQIEFIYRDGKQHTGLEHCQARNSQKLYFHWNMSLTAVNIAKAIHWLSQPKEQRGSFSMSDIKTLYHNELLLNRFLYMFAINANKPKNKEKIRQLLNFGTIAA